MRAASRMGKIIFGGKQFFLGTIRLVRAWLLPFGLTPARFNMLCAIASERGGIPQHKLRSLLGVTTATICRMLKSLEKLGLITRKPHPRNSRHRWLNVTASGAFALRSAISEVVQTTELAWAIAEMLNPEPLKCDLRKVSRAIDDADRMFSRARTFLGDIATLQFPFKEMTLDSESL